MKIVIDIPEKAFEVLTTTGVDWLGAEHILDAVANGTVLPKGHGALKDADKLAVAIAMIRDKYDYYGNEYERAMFEAYDHCVDEITDTPTIIEADEEIGE